MIALDVVLVQRLVASQFSQWKELSVWPVARSGWDNRTFHLGEQMLVRMPSAECYAAQVEKEHLWLPKLAPLLPLPIPVPLAMGKPAQGYPFHWSVYRWLEGEAAASVHVSDLCDFARDVAQFLNALHRIDASGGPQPGDHNFYRGGNLSYYDSQTRQALALLKGKIDCDLAAHVWEIALSATWNYAPVWVHGDMSVGNLLVDNGRLSAVIDFGQLAVGDPACDLVLAWTLFKNESRDVFYTQLSLDGGTWARARGWALWKALIIAAGLTGSNNVEGEECWRVIDEVLCDRKN